MTRPHRALLIAVPMLIGCGLLIATIAHTDLQSIGLLARQIGASLPLLLLPSAVWHVLRTIAWRRCFPPGPRPSFRRTFRVRLAAEAFSWVTISGLGGEPLKVVLLDGHVPPAVAAGAVALERIVYILTTAGILAISAAVAIWTLPLTNAWARIFGGVVIAGSALVTLTMFLLLRRSGQPNASATSCPPRSAVARFVVAIDDHVRRAVRENPRRMAELIALESAAYLMMALEVWTVFRCVDVAATMNAAFAVETLTRIASMASAFIPGNLGALEASNVAAATAVHAVGGAAALALARRMRGLAWCAAGFIIYPRPRARGAVRDGDAIVIIEDPDSDVLISEQLGGMPIGERVLRAAARAGCSRVLVWAPRQHRGWDAIAKRAALPLDVSTASDMANWRLHLESLGAGMRPIVVAPGIVPSPQVIESVRAGRECGNVFRVDIDELRSPATLTMPPRADVEDGLGLLSLSTKTPNDLESAERQLRESIFKPTDGLFGRFNRRISIPISIGLIRLMRLSAHAMSAVVLVAGLYAGWLFGQGNYVNGVLAGVISLVASVLDGCDGELARLQYTDSAFGCWIDTLGDYTYYLSVFTGLAVGVARRTDWPGFWWIGMSLLVGVVATLSLLILLRGRIAGGRPEKLRSTANAHFETAGKTWTTLVARLSMCATRATMPYGLLIFALLNLLPVFVVLAAIGAHVYWISLALQLKSLLNRLGSVGGESPEAA